MTRSNLEAIASVLLWVCLCAFVMEALLGRIVAWMATLVALAVGG